MTDSIQIEKGKAFTFQGVILVDDGEGLARKVTLTRDAATAATSLTVAPLDYALVSGDVLLFGKSSAVTVGASGAVAGAVTVPVAALAGPLFTGQRGYLLADLTGAILELELLRDAEDASPLVTISGAAVTLLNQAVAATRGRFNMAITAAATLTLPEGDYKAFVWRRNVGSERPQIELDARIVAAGFLS